MVYGRIRLVINRLLRLGFRLVSNRISIVFLVDGRFILFIRNLICVARGSALLVVFFFDGRSLSRLFGRGHGGSRFAGRFVVAEINHRGLFSADVHIAVDNRARRTTGLIDIICCRLFTTERR